MAVILQAGEENKNNSSSSSNNNNNNLFRKKFHMRSISSFVSMIGNNYVQRLHIILASYIAFFSDLGLNKQT